MADFGIKPEIALGVKGPQAMTLGDLVGTATKAMEFSKLSELYPELINKARAESQSTQFGLAERQMGAITSGMTALINNPLVVRAEEAPDQVDPQKLLSYVTEHGYNQAKMLNIPREKADVLMAPYIKMAMENPAGLRGYAKERLLAGLDTASRASAFGGAQGIGALKQVPPQMTDRPVGVTPADMTAPRGAAVSQVPPSEVQAAPMGQAPMGQAPMAQAPAQAPMAQAPQGGAGFALPYPIPIRGVQQATTPSEATDLATGQKYRTDLLTGQATVPKASRNVDAVLSGIKELEKDRRFTTGPLASREQYIKEFFGDERFKQLSKDIANVEIATLKAQGFSTDADKSLNARANGDETYPPSVLLSVANRLAGDLTRLDMEAKGAQKFAQQFGDSNLPAYRQAWAANADQKIFEAMFIQKNERDPKRRQEALTKLLPNDAQELMEFKTKLQNIKRLSDTGRLK